MLAMMTFMHIRPVIGAMATGLARSTMEYAINYAKQREAFEKKLYEFQAIQHMIADMYARIEAMKLLTWREAWLLDQGEKRLDSCQHSKARRLRGRNENSHRRPPNPMEEEDILEAIK